MEHYESASAAERALMDAAGKTRMPVSGSMELLPLCNMNCDMFYVRLCHYPDGFERVTQAVRLLRAHGVEVRMNCSIAKENAPVRGDD